MSFKDVYFELKYLHHLYIVNEFTIPSVFYASNLKKISRLALHNFSNSELKEEEEDVKETYSDFFLVPIKSILYVCEIKISDNSIRSFNDNKEQGNTNSN